MVATHLDSSAIVKLVIAEPESAALRRFLRRRRPLVSSALARTEVMRALLLEGERGRAQGRAALASLPSLIRTEVPRASRLVSEAEFAGRFTSRSLDRSLFLSSTVTLRRVRQGLWVRLRRGR